jgi:aspartate carbamoyltransferase regulatory subunit
MEKTLSVSAIKEGSVIDHVEAGSALKIIRILNLPAKERMVTVGLNLASQRQGRKDIIKVSGKEITPKEANRIALLSPEATVNIIRNYTTFRKFKVEMPNTVEEIIVCPNPKCITNYERMLTNFHILRHNGTTELSCNYCEKIFTIQDIREYKI